LYTTTEFTRDNICNKPSLGLMTINWLLGSATGELIESAIIYHQGVGQGPNNRTGAGQKGASAENSPPNLRGGETASRAKGKGEGPSDPAEPTNLGRSRPTFALKLTVLGRK
jgi:hypothetical protein